MTIKRVPKFLHQTEPNMFTYFLAPKSNNCEITSEGTSTPVWTEVLPADPEPSPAVWTSWLTTLKVLVPLKKTKEAKHTKDDFGHCLRKMKHNTLWLLHNCIWKWESFDRVHVLWTGKFSGSSCTIMFVSSNQGCPKSNVGHLQLSAQKYITNRKLFNSLLKNWKQPLWEKSEITPEVSVNIKKRAFK